MDNLKEWIDSCNYANEMCKKMNAEEYNIKLKHYVVEEHKLGIYVGLFDSSGNLFKEYASGVFYSFEQMKENLDYIDYKIRQDTREQKVISVVNDYERTGRFNMDEVKTLIAQKKELDLRKNSFGNSFSLHYAVPEVR